MSDAQAPPFPPERLAALARARSERLRAAAQPVDSIDAACGAALALHRDRRARQDLVQTAAAVAARKSAARSASSEAAEAETAAEALRQRAAVELRLAAETERVATLETQLRRESADRREAIDSLTLLRKRIAAVEQERDSLRTQNADLDAKLRIQTNVAEDARVQLERMKAARGAVSQSALDVTEEANALKTENDLLRRRLEETLQERDKAADNARRHVADALSRTADAAYSALWARLQTELPEVFSDTHVPTRETFERLADSLVTMLRLATYQERCVLQKLYELKDVTQQNDPLFGFLTMLKRTSLVSAARDFIAGGRNAEGFDRLMRSHQGWAEALATGLYKLIVRSPDLIRDEINPRTWPLKSPNASDGEVGRYLRQTGMQAIPDKLGTQFRKLAGQLAHQDYEFIIRERA